MPIVLLVFGLVKRGSLSELNLTNCSLRKGESCRAVASLHNFWRETDSESGTLSRFFVVLSSEAKVVLIFTPSCLRGDCNTAQWETHTGEKQRGLLCLPAVDYQSSCIWLLPLVLSLHAIMWLYGDGSVSKETTLEHFDSDICLTPGRIRSCCGTQELPSYLKVGKTKSDFTENPALLILFFFWAEMDEQWPRYN